MKVLINNKECLLNDIGKGGGEGDIYTVNYNGEIKCVKVYDYEKRTPYNERKIIAVINLNELTWEELKPILRIPRSRFMMLIPNVFVDL
jgi:hypothetical protein